MQAEYDANENVLDDYDEDDDEPPLLVALLDDDKDGNQQAVDTTTSSGTIVNNTNAIDDGALAPCPVTILSGFLGSGKTTLIQYILRSPDHGKRIAVIENEFGQGLDVESLIARDGASNESLQDLIELPNGCMCCTVKDSLVTTLEALVNKRADLDYILIECRYVARRVGLSCDFIFFLLVAVSCSVVPFKRPHSPKLTTVEWPIPVPLPPCFGWTMPWIRDCVWMGLSPCVMPHIFAHNCKRPKKRDNKSPTQIVFCSTRWIW